MLMNNCYMLDERIVKSVEEARVEHATGNSEAESIRDFDSGSSGVRFHRRASYWYRGEDNLNRFRYRRLYKPSVETEGELRDGTPPRRDSYPYVVLGSRIPVR